MVPTVYRHHYYHYCTTFRVCDIFLNEMVGNDQNNDIESNEYVMQWIRFIDVLTVKYYTLEAYKNYYLMESHSYYSSQ